MLYIAIGVLSFLCFLLFDIMSVRKRIISKYLFMFLGIVILIFSTVMMVKNVPSFRVPTFLHVISIVGTIIFFILLVYSVFIEVGIVAINRNSTHTLVTNGTYSLTRHPGVIWLFLTYVCGAISFENSNLLLAAIVWTIINVAYVFLQELYIFTKLFQGYKEYAKQTPMIIPNYNSIKRFMTSNNWRKE